MKKDNFLWDYIHLFHNIHGRNSHKHFPGPPHHHRFTVNHPIYLIALQRWQLCWPLPALLTHVMTHGDDPVNTPAHGSLSLIVPGTYICLSSASAPQKQGHKPTSLLGPCLTSTGPQTAQLPVKLLYLQYPQWLGYLMPDANLGSFLPSAPPDPSYCFFLAKVPPSRPGLCFLLMCIFSLYLFASFFPSACEYLQYPWRPH